MPACSNSFKIVWRLECGSLRRTIRKPIRDRPLEGLADSAYSFPSYYPKDLSTNAAREKLGTLQKSSDPVARVANYKDVIKRVHPVMRHFFTEKYYLPSHWFEMRLLYSRSAAVMSMVGHILGLGDRHVSNIMIDTAKGELIPIDFGIMFEAVSVFSYFLQILSEFSHCSTGQAPTNTGTGSFPPDSRHGGRLWPLWSRRCLSQMLRRSYASLAGSVIRTHDNTRSLQV